MDAESMPLPNYVVLRKGVYQYVRRVPDDIADAFASLRIQRSLRTRLPGEARVRAAEIDQDIERQFADARRRKGVSSQLLSTAGWTWVEWSRAADWLKATWLRDDQMVRLKGASGAAFSSDRVADTLWLDDTTLRTKIALRKRLLASSVEDYVREQGARLNASLASIGVLLPPADPYRSEFIAACLQAEVEALEIVFRREGGERIDHAHPDSIDGPWRSSVPSVAPPLLQVQLRQDTGSEPEPGPLGVSVVASILGIQLRSLSDCIDAWIKERQRLKKKVDSHLVNDMRATTAWFETFCKVTSIEKVRRRHVIGFRDHLFDKGVYKTATINKKVGFVTSLMALAAAKGWVENAIEGGIYIEIPNDEDKRDSYSADELSTLFASPVFTQGLRSASVKAGGELQFWLPLIACCHGMISSEILQLGPDTMVLHPESDVWCFRVTNAGGRTIKTYARERYVPVRKELIELGILDLSERAGKRNWATLWEAMEQPEWTVSNMSNYFSAYWTAFSRKQLGTALAQKSLYSFRHAFKDELDRQTAPLEIKKALMGHADSGTTGRYGTKSSPRPVNVEALRSVIDGMDWRFLSKVRRTKLESER